MKFLNMTKYEAKIDFGMIDKIVGFRGLRSNLDLVTKNEEGLLYAWTVHDVATGHYVRGAELICTQNFEVLLSVSVSKFGTMIEAIWHRQSIVAKQRVDMLVDEPKLVRALTKSLELEPALGSFYNPWKNTPDRWFPC